MTEGEDDFGGFFIRMDIDIGCLASRASIMDSTTVSILEIRAAVVSGPLAPSRVGAIDDENG